MLRHVGALAGLASWVATAGCATKAPPFSQDALRASKPLTLIVAVDRSPPITAEGPAREGFRLMAPGLMGAAILIGQDQTANQKRARWMRGCDLDDPVDDIRGDVAEALTGA